VHCQYIVQDRYRRTWRRLLTLSNPNPKRRPNPNPMPIYPAGAPHVAAAVWALLEAKKIPILGICYGMQELAHHFGRRRKYYAPCSSAYISHRGWCGGSNAHRFGAVKVCLDVSARYYLCRSSPTTSVAHRCVPAHPWPAVLAALTPRAQSRRRLIARGARSPPPPLRRGRRRHGGARRQARVRQGARCSTISVVSHYLPCT
jgi:hypothetical protein